MEKKKIFKVLSKKAMLNILAATAISGVIPAGFAFAQGELNAELVAEQGVSISGKPGETIQVPVYIYVTPKGTGQTSDVTVTANLDGQPSQTITFNANEFNIKKKVLLEYTIPQTTAAFVSPEVIMTSTDEKGNDKVSNEKADFVIIHVIQTPKDTTAPTVSLADPINGIYNAHTLPGTFKFNLDEAGEMFVNGVSQGPYTEGAHELTLPAPAQGNNTVSLKAIDQAGNESTTVSFTYIYDSINPLVTAAADRDPNTNGWYNQDVTVSFTAIDENGTGVASVDDPVTVSDEGQNQAITGKATDKAGNIGTGSLTLNIDKTAPTISGSPDRAPNEAGWYNDDVIISFSANDELSGVASVTEPVKLSEGKNQTVEGTATDFADNSSTADVSGINIDKTNPVIIVEDGGTYTLNQAVTWSASDALSGLATDSSGTIDTSKVGPQTKTITAIDKAGNQIEKTINYNVVYNFGGILQPINKDGSSVFKAGSTVPVKFQLTDSQGAFVSTANATIKYAKYNEKVLGTELEAASTSAATSGNLFRYDPTSNQYIFNLSTKGLEAGTYQVSIILGDGTTKKVQISLK